MTAKEKADELFTNFRFVLSLPNAPLGENKDIVAKQCVMNVVDEILGLELNAKCESQFVIERHLDEYWTEVKKEIELL